MGTQATVTLVTGDSVTGAARAAAAHVAFHRVDSLMSNWSETSEIARINREADRALVTVHPEVATVVAAALRVGKESGGAFDITVEPLVRLWGFLGGSPRVPDAVAIQALLPLVGSGAVEFDAATRSLRFARVGVRIDLGGIAKGYGVDVAAEALRAAGVTDALVDLAGNMRALGHPPGRDHWLIGIRDPRGQSSYIARLRLANRAVSTSGAYEQFVAQDGRTYGHILNPRTGFPAEGLIAVTVVTPAAMEADAWSTALFVLGPEAARRAARARADLDAILIEPGTGGVDTVWVESSLGQDFELEPADAARFRLAFF